MIAAFGCYFCVYGFRKPFTAGTYEDQFFMGIHWKSILISSQIAGYMLSKWCGIFFVSSITWEKRAKAIIISIVIAELALLCFGLVPKPYNLIFLLLNGLPLGMIFGYIQGFLEGKKNTELFIAALGSSFILADGVSKSVGVSLLNWGVAETWMPFAAGLIYALPFLFFVWMLTQIPRPTAEEVADRAERQPMTQKDRIQLVMQLWPGIIAISLLYLFAALLRGIRSDFAPEIWHYLGYEGVPSIYSQTEIWVTVGILVINGSLVLIKRNYLAFFISLSAIATGYLLLVIAGLWGVNSMNSFWLIVLTGFGIYLPYLTITTSVFERLIAITRHKANIGFLMYIVDSVGYLGYNVLLIAAGFIFPNWNLPQLFFSWITILGFAGLALSAGSWVYFTKKLSRNPTEE
jgi:MFS family permease